MASLDRDVLVTYGVSGTDLGSFLNLSQIWNATVPNGPNSRCPEQWQRGGQLAAFRLPERGR
jgi:hypothetical protein